MVVMRRLMLVVAVPFFLVDGFAIYRRVTMLRRLNVHVDDAQLRAGSAVILDASSWATTMMTVRLELVQGARSETLLLHRLPPNAEATLDPRPRNARLRVVLTADQLARYTAGEATLRATATWRAQLLRTSRPVVRELPVRITSASQSLRAPHFAELTSPRVHSPSTSRHARPPGFSSRNRAGRRVGRTLSYE